MILLVLDLSFHRVENWSKRTLPVRLGEEIQEVLRRGDGELILSPKANYQSSS
jgi:hypothetical protein